jgi:hypothetical protein
MGISARKILTDGGTLYVAFDSVIDQFVTPAFASAADFADDACKILRDWGISREGWESLATDASYVYDLRRWTIHACVEYLAQLKRGVSLTNEQACELHEFTGFLEATVAFQQYNYELLNQAVVEQWIHELDLRSMYPPGYDWQDIVDACRSTVYYNAWSKKHYDFSADLETGRATPAQNKLIGRFISRECILANIAGPGKSTPAEIVETFFKKLQENKKVFRVALERKRIREGDWYWCPRCYVGSPRFNPRSKGAMCTCSGRMGSGEETRMILVDASDPRLDLPRPNVQIVRD